MERDYDIFERAQDHSLLWRGRVHGLENARRKLEQLARKTSNECSVIYQPTRQVVALANIPQATRVVFQVAYDERLLKERAELLRGRGYEVVSVMGNERAKAVLGLPERVDLFIVGHGGPEETRREMVEWLKRSYAKTPILALNPPEYQELAGANYNVELDKPEAWLSMVDAALE